MKIDKRLLIIAFLVLLLVVAGCTQPKREGKKVPVAKTQTSMVCGNNVMETGENCSNCPKDASCILGEKCVEGECVKVGDVQLCGNGVDDTDERLGISETPENCCQDVGCQSSLLECVNNNCVPLACKDNTPYEKCAPTKPLFCSSGELADKCSQCGCPEGYGCKEDESCVKLIKNLPPVVETDKPPAATLGDRVILGGTVNDEFPKSLKYEWVQLTGEKVTLKKGNTLTPDFTPIYPGTYEFELKASDGEFTSNAKAKVEVEVPGNAAFFALGKNKLVYADSVRVMHTLPLIIKAQFSSAGDKFFEIDGKKFYYSAIMDEQVKDKPKIFRVRALSANGPIVAETEFRDWRIEGIVSKDISYNVLDHYSMLVDLDADLLYIILKGSKFDMMVGTDLYFRGTDFRDRGDVFPGFGYEAYVPKEESFGEYGDPLKTKAPYVASFMAADEVTGVSRIKAYVDASTNELFKPEQNTRSYSGSVEYFMLKNARDTVTDTPRQLVSYYRDVIEIVDGMLIVKMPEFMREQ